MHVGIFKTLVATALVGSMLAVACVPLSVKQRIDKNDRLAYSALRGFQQAEESAWHTNQVWPSEAQHKQIGADLSKAYSLVADVAQAGIDLQAGQPISMSIRAEMADLIDVVTDIVTLTSHATPDVKSKALDAQQKSVAVTSVITNVLKSGR